MTLNTENELRPDMQGTPVGRFLSKIAGWFRKYWYFYKVYILIGTAALIFLVALIVTTSGKNREKYDNKLYCLTSVEITAEELETVTARIEPYWTDADGDGEVRNTVVSIVLSAVDTSDTAMSSYYQMLATVSEDDVQLMLVDDSMYEYLLEMNAFASLSDFGIEGILPDGSADDTRIWLNGTDIVKDVLVTQEATREDGSNRAASNLYLCIKVRPENGKSDSKSEARYASAAAFAAYASELAHSAAD